MSEEESTERSGKSKDSSQMIKVGVAVVVGVVALTGVTLAAYQYAKGKTGTVVLPGGVTYLGPSNEQKTPTAPLRFTISATTPWIEYKGSVFPYSFSYPDTLSLVVFPDDPTDSVAISWGNIPPQQNILLHVDNIRQNQAMKDYVNKPKRQYVDNWYKQFSGLKGAQSVEEFTNARGMKGYKAKYLNYADQAPNDDVFFEIPNRPELIARFANGILDPAIFNRIIDSFAWNTAVPTKAPQVVLPTTPLEPGSQGAGGQ